jgi:hypothetical protein
MDDSGSKASVARSTIIDDFFFHGFSTYRWRIGLATTPKRGVLDGMDRVKPGCCFCCLVVCKECLIMLVEW